MSRKLIAYSLMVFYIAFQLRPLTVVLSDALAHTFFRAQHMATIHYENGKYHVHADLKAISDNENGAKENSPASKKISEDTVHITQQFDMAFKPLSSIFFFPSALQADVLSAYLSLEVPPPKA